MALVCGGERGITGQALNVWKQSTGNSALQWSEASCADMTKNLTASFNRHEYYHHLYLKGTMREFVQTYGAACCGSLEKARDPCEVLLSAPAHANSDSIVTLCLVCSTCLLTVLLVTTSGDFRCHSAACDHPTTKLTSCNSSHGHKVLCDDDDNNALQVSLCRCHAQSMLIGLPDSAFIGALIPPPPPPHASPSTARRISTRPSKTSTRRQWRTRRARLRPMSTSSTSPKVAVVRGASRSKPR